VPQPDAALKVGAVREEKRALIIPHGTRSKLARLSMFCPLCQSEYRDGFTECSDCRVPLVLSREEANQSSQRLWKGDRQHSLNTILVALDAEGIPAHYKEIVYTGLRFTFLGISFPNRSTFEYEVWVFNSDAERARAAIGKLLPGLS
jgi:hypothetical protein